MKISNASLATKLWMAFGCVVVLLLFTLVTAVGRGNELNRQIDMKTTEVIAKTAVVARWKGLVQMNATRVTDSFLSTDPLLDNLYKEKIAATSAEISMLQKKIESMKMSEKERALLGQIAEDRKVLLAALSKAKDLKNAGDQTGAVKEAQSNFLPATDKYLKSMGEMVDLLDREGESLNDRASALRRGDEWFAQSLVGALIVSLGIGTWLLIKQIRRPLHEAIEVAENIAAGDLSAAVDTTRGDEFGQMMKAIAHMKDELTHLVGDVRTSTDSMASVSEEIATGNHDLSNRTEQSAASLEETASSMKELTSTVQRSAESAKQANQLAASAAQVAQRGGDVVGQVVATMSDINASSRKISDIISVIDGIAFQTNILALNAAVEAARAGEQGRGFAVVASEVRSLASRSAEAAKEIKTLINASVEKVEGGSQLVAQAGETMNEIVDSVQRVTDIMGGITLASAEQSDGIAQVNSAIAHLDQMTQQNAALVEQSAAAATSMKDQAQRLAALVSKFKLGGGEYSASQMTNVRAPAQQPTAYSKAPVLATAKRSISTSRSNAPRLPTASKPATRPETVKAPAAAEPTSGDDWETF